MAWCNKCKSEYEEHIKICADCGEELKKGASQEEQDSIEIMTETNDEKLDFQSYEKLINCKDNIEANVLISILESNNIRSTVKYESSGAYLNLYSGFNYQGVDVCVPIDKLVEAKEILKTFQLQDIKSDPELEDQEKKFGKNRKLVLRGIVFLTMLMLTGVLVIPVLIEILK